jgi:hypothetical protein
VKRRLLLLGALLLAVGQPAFAEVTRVEIIARSDVGASGYEKIVGRLHFAIDPAHPRNRLIADVALAPVNADGRVEFSSDLFILRPKNPAATNGAALLEVSNRGGKSLLGSFNRGGKNNPDTEADLGDAFLMRQGFTLVWVGWEFDVPPTPGQLRITVPVATDRGKTITGGVRAQWVADAASPTYTVTDLAAYSPLTDDDPAARLSVRASRSSGDWTVLPRKQWQLHGNVLSLTTGFEPGKNYELTYPAAKPPIAGLGFAAIRDAASWLKRANDALPPVRFVYGYGMSQSGRFLRDFLYHGFNTDERNRAAFEGVLAHIAGAARIDFNRRWSVPRELGLYPVAGFPFADTEQADAATGVRTGLLANPRVTHAPKIFYTNTSVEYVGGGRVAALTHFDPATKQDLAFPDNVRSYAFSGTQHGPGRFPPAAPTLTQERGNPADYWWIMRALLPALHAWVAKGTPPPPSAVPAVREGALVPIADLAFPALPQVASPLALTGGLSAPDALSPGKPTSPAALPLWVAQVDADGNERGGIRLPEVAVPLATYTGWNFRAPAAGSPQDLVLLAGSWIPFPLTRAAAAAAKDPRLSIEERYPTRADYFAKIEAATQALVRQGFLLPGDAPAIQRQALTRWDYLTQTKP